MRKNEKKREKTRKNEKKLKKTKKNRCADDKLHYCYEKSNTNTYLIKKWKKNTNI